MRTYENHIKFIKAEKVNAMYKQADMEFKDKGKFIEISMDNIWRIFGGGDYDYYSGEYINYLRDKLKGKFVIYKCKEHDCKHELLVKEVGNIEVTSYEGNDEIVTTNILFNGNYEHTVGNTVIIDKIKTTGASFDL